MTFNRNNSSSGRCTVTELISQNSKGSPLFLFRARVTTGRLGTEKKKQAPPGIDRQPRLQHRNRVGSKKKGACRGSGGTVPPRKRATFSGPRPRREQKDKADNSGGMHNMMSALGSPLRKRMRRCKPGKYVDPRQDRRITRNACRCSRGLSK